MLPICILIIATYYLVYGDIGIGLALIGAAALKGRS